MGAEGQPSIQSPGILYIGVDVTVRGGSSKRLVELKEKAADVERALMMVRNRMSVLDHGTGFSEYCI